VDRHKAGSGDWLGGTNLWWTSGRLLLSFLGSVKGLCRFSGFGVHVDNFIRWRLRSDIAETKGSYDSRRYLCVEDGSNDEGNPWVNLKMK